MVSVGMQYLKGEGLLQDVKQELQLEEGGSVGWVRRERKEAMLVRAWDQVLLKQTGQVLQVAHLERQGATAVQHTVTLVTIHTDRHTLRLRGETIHQIL